MAEPGAYRAGVRWSGWSLVFGCLGTLGCVAGGCGASFGSGGSATGGGDDDLASCGGDPIACTAHGIEQKEQGKLGDAAGRSGRFV